jgi:hypothetical protein
LENLPHNDDPDRHYDGHCHAAYLTHQSEEAVALYDDDRVQATKGPVSAPSYPERDG